MRLSSVKNTESAANSDDNRHKPDRQALVFTSPMSGICSVGQMPINKHSSRMMYKMYLSMYFD